MGKLFDIKMTWVKVVVLAVICGVVTGIIMQIPALDETSIHNIGVTMEFWILMAMIISVNCEKWWEAGVKTIVFFLISQPLVYLTMWPVYHGFPWGYYQYWFMWTIATLPMGCLAWYIKKGNILSMLILLVPCAFLCLLGAGCLNQAVVNFPRQLLAALFCFGQVALYVAVLLEDKKQKIIVGVLCLLVAAGSFGFMVSRGPNSICNYPLDNADQYSFSVADEGIVSISGSTDNDFSLHSEGYGSTTVTATAGDGTQVVYDVTVSRENSLIDITERSE